MALSEREKEASEESGKESSQQVNLSHGTPKSGLITQAEKQFQKAAGVLSFFFLVATFLESKTMNDTTAAAKQLRRIAERLRDINPTSRDDARRYLQSLTGDAAVAIKPHWNLVTERARINASGDWFPNNTRRVSKDEREEWEITWLTIAVTFNFGMFGRLSIGMPKSTEAMAPDGTVSEVTLSLNLDDWQHIAGDSANLCEHLADLIESPADSEWSAWHPPGDWWDKFPKSDSWCRSEMTKWLSKGTVQRKGERGDIRFRLSFLKELDIEPPS